MTVRWPPRESRAFHFIAAQKAEPNAAMIFKRLLIQTNTHSLPVEKYLAGKQRDRVAMFARVDDRQVVVIVYDRLSPGDRVNLRCDRREVA